MDPTTGYPWIMRKVNNWPRIRDFNSWRFNPTNYDVIAYTKETVRVHKQVVQQNQRYEAALNQLSNYELGDFVLPDLADAGLHQALYYRKALALFDTFYDDALLREQLIALLPKEIEYQPASLTAEAKTALSAEEDNMLDSKVLPTTPSCIIS